MECGSIGIYERTRTGEIGNDDFREKLCFPVQN
jgi:hypothetical protein